VGKKQHPVMLKLVVHTSTTVSLEKVYTLNVAFYLHLKETKSYDSLNCLGATNFFSQNLKWSALEVTMTSLC
jgi:hypothetical protein